MALRFPRYDPELFGKALPCLTAIACALPPDYAKSAHSDSDYLYAGRFAAAAAAAAVPADPMQAAAGMVGPDGAPLPAAAAVAPAAADVGPYTPSPIHTEQ